MARIRTIKPEFPQSESMGRVSRDARLLFVMLWTICDDSGVTRAASRMLASLLFPYDDDAPSLIDGWLSELAEEGCIDIYEAEGSHYLKVRKWLNHQKIDKPSPSKFPPFDESSRKVAKPRECSSEDQGPRTKDQGREGMREDAPLAQKQPPSQIVSCIPTDWKPDQPTLERLKMDGLPEPKPETVVAFRAHHEAKGTMMELRRWGSLFVKWCAQQRAYDAVRGVAAGVKVSDTDQAWQSFRAHIRAGRCPDEPILRAITIKMGGSNRLGEMTSKDIDFKRKEFDQMYHQISGGQQ